MSFSRTGKCDIYFIIYLSIIWFCIRGKTRRGIQHVGITRASRSRQALQAAVQNGADAVYLGAGAFNARMGARNFSMEELAEAVTYCHIRGVRVYLTVNTLVTDREMERAAELLAQAAVCGVDAFIVQDLGLVSLCHQMAPGVPVHASTQMSIHSLEGARQAAEMGLARVIVAREMSEENLRYLCRHSPVEVEVIWPTARCACATRGSAISPPVVASAAATGAVRPAVPTAPTASAGLRTGTL